MMTSKLSTESVYVWDLVKAGVVQSQWDTSTESVLTHCSTKATGLSAIDLQRRTTKNFFQALALSWLVFPPTARWSLVSCVMENGHLWKQGLHPGNGLRSMVVYHAPCSGWLVSLQMGNLETLTERTHVTGEAPDSHWPLESECEAWS